MSIIHNSSERQRGIRTVHTDGTVHPDRVCAVHPYARRLVVAQVAGVEAAIELRARVGERRLSRSLHGACREP